MWFSHGDAAGRSVHAAVVMNLLRAGNTSTARCIDVSTTKLDTSPDMYPAVSNVGSLFHRCCSPPRPYRLGAPQPASPELEQFLSDTAASDGQVTIEQLQALFPFQLDGFQEKAVEQLLEGRSVVVCAPTGKCDTQC